jgi:hypothetical protein
MLGNIYFQQQAVSTKRFSKVDAYMMLAVETAYLKSPIISESTNIKTHIQHLKNMVQDRPQQMTKRV